MLTCHTWLNHYLSKSLQCTAVALFPLNFEGFDLCVFWYDVASPGAILVIGKLWGLTREEGEEGKGVTPTWHFPVRTQAFSVLCGRRAVFHFRLPYPPLISPQPRVRRENVESFVAPSRLIGILVEMKLRSIALRDSSCMSRPIIFWLNPFSEAMSYVFSSFMIPNFEVSPLNEGKGWVSYRD